MENAIYYINMMTRKAHYSLVDHSGNDNSVVFILSSPWKITSSLLFPCTEENVRFAVSEGGSMKVTMKSKWTFLIFYGIL